MVASRRLTALHALRHAAILAGLGYLVLVWLGVADYGPPYLPYGTMGDAHAYWAAPAGNPYVGAELGTQDAFLYSPAFAQVIGPLKVLPFHVFYAVLVGLGFGVLLYLRVPYLISFPPVIDDLLRGNVHLLMAGAIFLGLRYPGAWAFVLLTKVTPGVGVLWFAVRRDWRSLAWALGATAAIVAVSFMLAPAWWPAWIASLQGNASVPSPPATVPVPFAVRIGPAIAILVFAALTNRRWLVPISCCLALPVIWPSGLALLIAAVPLWRDRRWIQSDGNEIADARSERADQADRSDAAPSTAAPLPPLNSSA